MFNPFKKNNKTTVQMPIDELWQDFLFDNQSFTGLLSHSFENGVLELSVRLPASVNPELLYEKLCEHIANKNQNTIKIDEINLTVVSAKPNAQSDANRSNPNLPKTTNAMQKSNQNQEHNNQNSPETGTPNSPQNTLAPHPRIRHIIAVASGKGGVGKSTTTVNLALALQALGHRVGVLDADIYGPSVPTMLGVADKKPAVENEQFVPIDAFGMPVLSIGSLLDSEQTPVAWRGIKAVGALMQLYGQTNWPTLDYLLIDMPPGTGDIALSLAQKVPMTGAVIVTTPQHIALLDVKKGIELFKKTNIPVIGVVENMSVHICSNCGYHEPIFGGGFGGQGGDEMAKTYGVPLLGRLPLARAICENADKGKPSVAVGDDFASYYQVIAQKITDNIGQFAKKKSDRIF